MIRALPLPLLLIALLVSPAPASADDQSLANTYAFSHSDRLRDASDTYRRAIRRINRSGGRNRRAARVAIAADRRIAGILGEITDELRADTPSSDPGGEAKRWAIRALLAWRTQVRLDARAFELALQGKRSSSRFARRSRRAFTRFRRYDRRAVAAFEEAGVTPVRPTGT